MIDAENYYSSRQIIDLQSVNEEQIGKYLKSLLNQEWRKNLNRNEVNTHHIFLNFCAIFFYLSNIEFVEKVKNEGIPKTIYVYDKESSELGLLIIRSLTTFFNLSVFYHSHKEFEGKIMFSWVDALDTSINPKNHIFDEAQRIAMLEDLKKTLFFDGITVRRTSEGYQY